MYSTELDVSDRDHLPKPTGYRLLVALPKVEKKSAGGVHLPDKLIKAEESASVIANIIDMGPDCYKDETKFPSGPWCQIGDWVLIRSYSGTRFKVKTADGGTELRLLNDDAIEAVVTDPRGIERAF